jgi:hypothetical protein
MSRLVMVKIDNNGARSSEIAGKKSQEFRRSVALAELRDLAQCVQLSSASVYCTRAADVVALAIVVPVPTHLPSSTSTICLTTAYYLS